VVLLMASMMLATLMRDGVPRLARANTLDPAVAMPGTLDNYALRFEYENDAAAPPAEVHAAGHAGGGDR
jgi:hypothetical protein